ncbi:DUF1761 domain-containing protein [Candidatus Parcubacteria bacterium]|nr:DUF1761 domain-containing protein [Candidatus Parcubacteria bacterium]
MFEGIDLNYLAILIAGLAAMPIGIIWFGPLFSLAWMKENGLSKEELAKGPKGGYFWTMIASLVEAWILAYFIAFAGAQSLAEGLLIGAMAAVGFMATTLGINYIFAQKSMKLYLIDIGYQAITVIVMGGILAAWQ